MKEAIVSSGGEAGDKVISKLVEAPIPRPGPAEVVIKVVVSGSNPKDWKYPLRTNSAYNSGDDIAGTVHEIGSDVTGFRPGDRVAAFHRMGEPHGSFAEYALAPANTTFHIPGSVGFEEAATVPLAAMTAALALFVSLGLPEPWSMGREDGRQGTGKRSRTLQPSGPLLVYGAASAIGAFAIQLAKRAGIGPIIAIAGRGIPFVESLLRDSSSSSSSSRSSGKEEGDEEGKDVIIDYRKGDEAVVSGIKAALKGQELRHVFDAVSEKGSYVNACKAMATSTGGGDRGRIAVILPNMKYEEIPRDQFEVVITLVSDAYTCQSDFGLAWFRLFSKGLAEGWLRPHPHEVVKGGLEGVGEGLADLMNGKNSALKYVFRIADTPGVKL